VVCDCPVQRYSEVCGLGAKRQGFVVVVDFQLTFGFLVVEVEDCQHCFCSSELQVWRYSPTVAISLLRIPSTVCQFPSARMIGRLVGRWRMHTIRRRRLVSQRFFFFSSSERVVTIYCLAALDLRADVKQPFDCLIVQNRQAVQRSMDWTLEDDTVHGLFFCSTLTSRRRPYPICTNRSGKQIN